MNRPDFLIIGAAKSATTWLQNSLQTDPGIFMPDPELHFFSRHYDKGLRWYSDQIQPPGSDCLIGEKSNSYLTDPQAAKRIHDFCPDVRLIVQMRDPVMRAYSDYCMLMRRGEVTGQIEDHLDPTSAAHNRFIADGRYKTHLDRFYDLFDRDQILLLFFEDVATNPHQQLDSVARHIGLGRDLAPPIRAKVKDAKTPVVPPRLRKILHPLRPVLDPLRQTKVMRMMRQAVVREIKYPPLSPALRSALYAHYQPDITAIETMTGRHPGPWQARQN